LSRPAQHEANYHDFGLACTRRRKIGVPTMSRLCSAAMGRPSREVVRGVARGVGAALVAATLTLGPNAIAAGPLSPKACIKASIDAQEMRSAGRWASAKEALAICSDPACPAMIRHDCSQWMAEITAATPTIVLGAVDASGTDLTDFQVFVDNTEMTSRVSAQAIPVDPGAHVVRYVRAGSTPVERQFVVREGEKARSLVVTMTPVNGAAGAPLPVPPAEAPHGFWTNTRAAVALGAVAIVTAGVGAFFAYEDVTHTSVLDSECLHGACPPGSPNRDRVPSQVTTVNAERALTGVSFGLGAAALAAMTYVLVAHPIHAEQANAAPPVKASWLPRVSLDPLPRGAAAGLRLAF
jgi:hypothetical protein